MIFYPKTYKIRPASDNRDWLIQKGRQALSHPIPHITDAPAPLSEGVLTITIPTAITGGLIRLLQMVFPISEGTARRTPIILTVTGSFSGECGKMWFF